MMFELWFFILFIRWVGLGCIDGFGCNLGRFCLFMWLWVVLVVLWCSLGRWLVFGLLLWWVVCRRCRLFVIWVLMRWLIVLLLMVLSCWLYC